MAIVDWNPTKLIDYYNNNKDNVSAPVAEERHMDLFTGNQIKTFTGTLKIEN